MERVEVERTALLAQHTTTLNYTKLGGSTKGPGP